MDKYALIWITSGPNTEYDQFFRENHSMVSYRALRRLLSESASACLASSCHRLDSIRFDEMGHFDSNIRERSEMSSTRSDVLRDVEYEVTAQRSGKPSKSAARTNLCDISRSRADFYCRWNKNGVSHIRAASVSHIRLLLNFPIVSEFEFEFGKQAENDHSVSKRTPLRDCVGNFKFKAHRLTELH